MAAKTFEMKSILLGCRTGTMTYRDPVPDLETFAASGVAWVGTLMPKSDRAGMENESR